MRQENKGTFCRDNAHCRLIVRALAPWQPWQPQAPRRRACCPLESLHWPPCSACLKVACLWGSHRMGMLRKSDKELGLPGGNHGRAGQGRLYDLRLVTVSLWASKFPSVLGKGPGPCQEGYLNCRVFLSLQTSGKRTLPCLPVLEAPEVEISGYQDSGSA